MNLLLLLSALLTALSGASAHARPVVPQALAARAASQIVAAQVAPVRTIRPADVLPDRRLVAAAPEAAALDLTAAEPIFARRRRE
ncbi:MAG: hypothetical protein K2P79_09080 [Sphingomonas sp.]|nr:hypothetical protein [Sphingomonas sp.]